MSLHHELEEERHIINADASSLNAPLTVTPMGALRELQMDIDGNFSRVDAERLAHSWNALPLRNAQLEAVSSCIERMRQSASRCKDAGSFTEANVWHQAAHDLRRAIEESGRA